MPLIHGQGKSAGEIEREISSWDAVRFARLYNAVAWASTWRAAQTLPAFTERVIVADNGMSTIDPLAARRFAERLGAKGVTMLDAPVSGGTHGAAAATLSVIVGGLAETFAASQDLFRAMGKNVFHVGGLGHGLAMKLINNMLGQIGSPFATPVCLWVLVSLQPPRVFIQKIAAVTRARGLGWRQLTFSIA